MKSFTLALAVFAAAMIAAPAGAASIIDFDISKVDDPADFRSPIDLMIGNLIEVGGSSITISHLGLQDPDGIFDGGGDVGLWNEDGTSLLASVTVVSTDALAADNYRYHALTSNLTLFANTRYLIAGDDVNEGFWDEDISGTTGRNPYSGNGITVIAARHNGTIGAGLTIAPLTAGGGTAGRWGAGNALIVPEPSCICLALLGFLGTGLIRRRRKE